jgi:hypothetical protein
MDFIDQSYRLDNDPKIGDEDKIRHCLANCYGANRGPVGKATAEVLSNFKEWFDENIKGSDKSSCMNDQKANAQGRRGGNCGATCSVDALRGVGLDMSGFPKDPLGGITNPNPRPYKPIDW